MLVNCQPMTASAMEALGLAQAFSHANMHHDACYVCVRSNKSPYNSIKMQSLDQSKQHNAHIQYPIPLYLQETP